MKLNAIKIHPDDNVFVAIKDIEAGETLNIEGTNYHFNTRVPAKHKFTAKALDKGDKIFMYGVVVGNANEYLKAGSLLTTFNVKHATSELTNQKKMLGWKFPDVSRWKDKTFMGFHRADGKVGTKNYWLVIPLVFCENRNIDVLKEALVSELGYERSNVFKDYTRTLLKNYNSGQGMKNFHESIVQENVIQSKRIFPNVDGIKFLTHDGGCGGTREDAKSLCGMLAGYITNANVAGATILSLGCQNAQVSILKEEINSRDSQFSKPLYILEQQQMGTEDSLIKDAIKNTLEGLIIANNIQRKEAPLSKLNVGLECGGSDGFSGISANPVLGYFSDLLVGLGGTVILSEFPELCGVENELQSRCVNEKIADRFLDLMVRYQSRAKAVGSGFDMNPSPGNIKDGLITDAMKSAGAAKKGGSSPIVDVLDYPEVTTNPGLNLLCTPGNDVESTSAEVSSGATLVLFTTGLGTPTGNPIAPVIKISSNTALSQKMSDIIDINAGTIIEGKETIQKLAEDLLDYVCKVANGEIIVSAERRGQEDFIPWKRGISL